jgi:hypothetical protein
MLIESNQSPMDSFGKLLLETELEEDIINDLETTFKPP